MKKIAPFLLFVFCLLLLFSCDDDQLTWNNGDFGRVYIQRAAVRSILPDFSEEYVTGFNLYISSTETQYEEYIGWSPDLEYWGYDRGDARTQEYVEVPVGTWDFILRGIDSDFNQICEGRISNVTITRNYSDTLAFSLSPINSGCGNIYIRINFPEDAGIVEVITSINGEVLDPPLDVYKDYCIYETNWDVESGDYLYVLKLLDAEERIVTAITEIVVVRQNLESRKIIELGEDDINLPPKIPLEFIAQIVSVSGSPGIRLSWIGASGTETGFVINDGTDDYEIDGSLGIYTLPSLSTGSFRIKALNDFGESQWSESIEAQLAAPETVTVETVLSTSISLSWDTVFFSTGYRVYRSTNSAGVYAYVGDSSDTSYTDYGLTEGTAYYYKIAAYNTDSEGFQTSFASGTTLPAAPTGVRAAARSPVSITVSWDPVDGATGYYIYRSTISSGTYTKVGASDTATSYTDNELTASTAYYYKVSAINVSGEGEQSSFVSETIVTYTITFDANGGTGTTPTSQIAVAGSRVTLPGGSGLSRNGYSFGGWNTNAAGTGTNYNESSSYTVNTNITLYATWNLGTPGSEINPFPLTRNIWTSGAITTTASPNNVAWYSFEVVSGTSYYIWWNDSLEGNNTKTMRIRIDAYHSNGSTILYNEAYGWTTPRSFSANANGTIRIKVSAYSTQRNTGTFGITYNTSNAKPVVP